MKKNPVVFWLLCLHVLSLHNHCSCVYIAPPGIAVCTNGDVRLNGGRIESEGRVEICFNNHWGTVCDDNWGEEDAQVVCRQLDFPTESMYKT